MACTCNCHRDGERSPRETGPATAAKAPRPDGVLVRRSGLREAVEVELTPKRDRSEYDRKLEWYVGQTEYGRVHWFVPSATLRARLNTVAGDLRSKG